MKIPQIKIPTCHVFCDNGTSYVGELNEYQFMYLRVEILRNGLKGYSVATSIEGNKHIINSDGRVHNWPEDLFPFLEVALSRILAGNNPKDRIDRKCLDFDEKRWLEEKSKSVLDSE